MAANSTSTRGVRTHPPAYLSAPCRKVHRRLPVRLPGEVDVAAPLLEGHGGIGVAGLHDPVHRGFPLVVAGVRVRAALHQPGRHALLTYMGEGGGGGEREGRFGAGRVSYKSSHTVFMQFSGLVCSQRTSPYTFGKLSFWKL